MTRRLILKSPNKIGPKYELKVLNEKTAAISNGFC